MLDKELIEWLKANPYKAYVDESLSDEYAKTHLLGEFKDLPWVKKGIATKANTIERAIEVAQASIRNGQGVPGYQLGSPDVTEDQVAYLIKDGMMKKDTILNASNIFGIDPGIGVDCSVEALYEKDDEGVFKQIRESKIVAAIANDEDVHSTVGYAMTGWDRPADDELKAFEEHYNKVNANPDIIGFASEEVAKSVIKQASLSLKDPRMFGILFGAGKESMEKFISDSIPQDGQQQLASGRRIKQMGDIGFYDGYSEVPKYSKAQIGQALANKKRALKAGNKLRRKQKAQAIKSKGY